MRGFLSRKLLWGGALASIVSASMMITACGGGGSSAGAGGGGGGASSTVVLQVSGIAGSAGLYNSQGQPEGFARVATAISEIFIRNAWAQTEGVNVYLGADAVTCTGGVLVGTTDATGTVMFPATVGTYTIRLEYNDPVVGLINQCIENVVVPPDSIVTIADITLDAGQFTHSPPVVDDGTGDQFAHKETICHKGKNTLSVGKPAVPAHLAHGDSIGACVAAAPPTGGDQQATEDNKGNGKNKNKS